MARPRRKPRPDERHLANLNPPVQSSEEARALVMRRWENRPPVPPELQTTSVRVSVPNWLLARIEQSGKGRSELVVELLTEWAKD